MSSFISTLNFLFIGSFSVLCMIQREELPVTSTAGAAKIYLPSYSRTLKSETLEFMITPPKGWSNSSTTKSALAADNAQADMTAITVVLPRGEQAKVEKDNVSQEINRTMSGIGNERCVTRWMRSKRAWVISPVICRACD